MGAGIGLLKSPGQTGGCGSRLEAEALRALHCCIHTLSPSLRCGPPPLQVLNAINQWRNMLPASEVVARNAQALETAHAAAVRGSWVPASLQALGSAEGWLQLPGAEALSRAAAAPSIPHPFRPRPRPLRS